MLNTFITGIIIGIFVSAPVGPLGVLCIQRTLNNGRIHGIVTGLGATTSDLFYALLVGFGMNYIIDFVEFHKLWIQILGSIIIFIFGIHIFRNNPVKQLRKSADGGSSNNIFANYASGFGLCFSNPLIVFLFVGLFARFSFFTPEQTLFHNIIGLFAIFAGAFLWWLTLTFIVGHLRGRFNLRGLWLFNKITGSILMLSALFGLVMGVLGITF
jgi:threonine/homoserine/homoserine lactone efflux protein